MTRPDMPIANHQPRVVLVTGGAGFMYAASFSCVLRVFDWRVSGSHFVLMLAQRYPDYQVINLDKLDYCSSLRTLEPLAGAVNYEFVRGNITSVDLVSFIMRSKNVDTVVHFAAQSHVDLSFDSSLDFTADNVLGTNVLLHCARMHGVKRFVHISTDEVYGTNTDGVRTASPHC